MKYLDPVIPRILFLTCLIGALFSISCNPSEESIQDSDIAFDIPTGFELEELFSPGDAGYGSWVSITEGPNNKYYASDQYGGIYTFQMPPIGDTLEADAIDSVALNMGYAHGLLWAFNSLYVVVVKGVDDNHPDDPSSGIYRLKDTTGDGQLDHSEKILTVSGDGEHGPHTLRVGPDGESLYFIAGNFNKVPDQFTSRLPRHWDEDNLFPQYLDASGHAVDLKAPGGWLAKTDPDGKEWELIGAGMRNPFSFGINADGELFAYDADMEWDFGMPWYRPTRILHVTSGAEFGWRTGSGKWPVYYPDNLPEVENMAQGSPTAVIMGKDLNFPSRYRSGLFACDWSFGTIYFVDIQEDGSSYTGKREEFLSGVPLPITNATAGSDGHLYFLIGGRRLNSKLYRVRYIGNQDITPIASSDANAKSLREIRKQLETYHNSDQNPESISTAWPYLNHSDRHIRYAARIALEHQPIGSWMPLIWVEEDDRRTIESTLAYARSGGPINNQIISKLESINWKDLSDDDQIGLLRAYALLLIRNERPSGYIRKAIADRLSPLFPAEDSRLNRELAQLLVYLEDDTAVSKSMALLEMESQKATSSHPEILEASLLERSEMYGPQIADMLDDMPPTEAIYYVTLLSHAKVGWTKKLRIDYFNWFDTALSKKGGVSYKAFLDNIRLAALENVPTKEKDYFRQLSGFYAPMIAMSELPNPIGPGKNYNLYDLGRIATWGDDKIENYKRSYQDGLRAYQAALCSSCHRMNGDGGISGPDLSNLHTRFNKGEIASAILSPNEEVSDQYAFTSFNLKNGETVVGRILDEDDDTYKIYQSPYNITATTEIKKSDVASKKISAISPMPAKLLNSLNEDEVLDLMVYLLAGGDQGAEYYQ